MSVHGNTVVSHRVVVDVGGQRLKPGSIVMGVIAGPGQWPEVFHDAHAVFGRH